MDFHEEVRLSFSAPGEIKRRKVVLDPQVSPEEIKNRQAGLRKLNFFCFSCYSAAVLRTLSL